MCWGLAGHRVTQDERALRSVLISGAMERSSEQFAQRESGRPAHTPPRFDAETRARLYELLRWR